MTNVEYTIEKTSCREYHKELLQKALKQIDNEFALSRNSVKPDDIVSNGRIRILVSRIVVCTVPVHIANVPICKYEGYEVTKENCIKKTLKRSVMYQTSVKTINGEPYAYNKIR